MTTTEILLREIAIQLQIANRERNSFGYEFNRKQAIKAIDEELKKGNWKNERNIRFVIYETL